jgi:hypothetical protein
MRSGSQPLYTYGALRSQNQKSCRRHQPFIDLKTELQKRYNCSACFLRLKHTYLSPATMTAKKVTAEQFQGIMDTKEKNSKKEKKSEKKVKKEKKRKLEDDESSQDNEKETVENTSEAPQEGDDDDDDDNSVDAGEGKSMAAKEMTGKEVRAARRKEREDLLHKVPKADENGIAYTKQQLRRMKKRVARGLDPIETSKEIHERLRQEAELRREEEEELSGQIHVKEAKLRDTDGDDEEGSDAEGEDAAEDDKFEKARKEMTGEEPQHKKPKRSKEVPTDYVCFACKNAHLPAHWIYDCPNKVTVRGTNSKSKDVRGIKNPDDKKVFVSGLPFEAKAKDVTEIFAPCGTITHCNLFTYDDTGRCKGQGIVSFETEEAAQKALQLSGTVIANMAAPPKKNAKDESPEEKRKTELKLKVTKVLNRSFTKPFTKKN